MVIAESDRTEINTKEQYVVNAREWVEKDLGLSIVEENSAKPWGAYLRIAETDAVKFKELLFAGFEFPDSMADLKFDPKLLIVEPGKRLSWQYHNRRHEAWRVVDGPVGVFISGSDDQPNQPQILHEREDIKFQAGERHRLIGLGNIGMVAELWIHTDKATPSDEEDIIRVQDDFGR